MWKLVVGFVNLVRAVIQHSINKNFSQENEWEIVHLIGSQSTLLWRCICLTCGLISSPTYWPLTLCRVPAWGSHNCPPATFSWHVGQHPWCLCFAPGGCILFYCSTLSPCYFWFVGSPKHAHKWGILARMRDGLPRARFPGGGEHLVGRTDLLTTNPKLILCMLFIPCSPSGSCTLSMAPLLWMSPT